MFKLLVLLSVIYLCRAISSISFYECERTKACFKTSKACTVDTCEFGISWKAVSLNGDNFIEFELIANVYSDNGYIILGFSEDKSLGNDGFVGCYTENKEVKIISGYNSDDGALANLIPLSSNQDQDLLVRKDGDKLGGIFNTLTKRIMCRFRRRDTPKTAAIQLKDLGNGKKYYLITARGTQASELGLEKPTAGSLVFSNEMVDFSTSSFNALGGSSKVDSGLAKSHGILMVISWILCSSVAIIVARYYKDMWPHTGASGEMAWFQVHRTLNVICVLLTTVAFILIFIHVRGYSELNTLPFKAHPILGIIVFILSFINPLLALCRCKPSAKDRPWFNWFHFFIGTIAYCLSVPTIMIGMRLPAAGLRLSQLDYPQWILIIFVIFQFIVEIILEIHGCLYYRRNNDKRHLYEMEMEEYQAALIAHHVAQTKPLRPRQSGRMCKNFMLGLHVTVAATVTIVLVVVIAVN